MRADAENPDDDLWGDVHAASDLLRCGVLWWRERERARERERERERARESEREQKREFVWGGDVLAASDPLICGIV